MYCVQRTAHNLQQCIKLVCSCTYTRKGPRDVRKMRRGCVTVSQTWHVHLSRSVTCSSFVTAGAAAGACAVPDRSRIFSSCPWQQCPHQVQWLPAKRMGHMCLYLGSTCFDGLFDALRQETDNSPRATMGSSSVKWPDDMQEKLKVLPKDIRELVEKLPEEKAREVMAQLIQASELSYRPLTAEDIQTIKVWCKQQDMFKQLCLGCSIAMCRLCVFAYSHPHAPCSPCLRSSCCPHKLHCVHCTQASCHAMPVMCCHPQERTAESSQFGFLSTDVDITWEVSAACIIFQHQST